MSWQPWADMIKDRCNCSAGGIFGPDGNAYASFGTDGICNITPSAALAVKQCMDSGDPTHSEVKIGGNKHIITKASDGQLAGKSLTKSCIVAVECRTCFVIAVGGEGSEPRQLLEPLSKVADLLKSHNF